MKPVVLILERNYILESPVSMPLVYTNLFKFDCETSNILLM